MAEEQAILGDLGILSMTREWQGDVKLTMAKECVKNMDLYIIHYARRAIMLLDAAFVDHQSQTVLPLDTIQV